MNIMDFFYCLYSKYYIINQHLVKTRQSTFGNLKTMPIRLSPMHTTNSRMLPFMLIQFIVSGSRYLAANAKQRAKGIMRVKSPVKSERKLIQVGL